MRRMNDSTRRLSILAAFLTAITGWGSASADYTFNLIGVTFQDGGTATGSFTTNNALTSLTAFNITTTRGTSFAGTTYASPATTGTEVAGTFLNFGAPASPMATYPSLTLLLDIGLSTTSPSTLSNESGEAYAAGGLERYITSGSVTVAPAATAVPEPASALMLGLGVAGAGLVGWKRSRRSAA